MRILYWARAGCVCGEQRHSSGNNITSVVYAANSVSELILEEPYVTANAEFTVGFFKVDR